MEKETKCMFCQRYIPEHEEKHLIPNKHVDVPVSHLIGCKECAKKAEKK
jgi:Pyruvate/2-oxoacid:ferredoxin oxidoreductase delta subunit